METCYFFMDSRAIADLVQPGELTTGWTITRINVPRESRGKGLGTKLLKRILADADRDAVNLWLEISPSDGLDFDQLKAWYERYGFRRHSSGYYVRMAQPLKTDMEVLDEILAEAGDLE